MKDEIISRLDKLKEYVDLLKGYQKYSLEQLKKDFTLRGAVERYLELALECIIDIGEMIISAEGFRKPENYREIIEILGEKNIIPKNFAEKFAPAAGFRNILVHMYTRIDINKVFSLLQNNLHDFEEFAKHVANYLKKK